MRLVVRDRAVGTVTSSPAETVRVTPVEPAGTAPATAVLQDTAATAPAPASVTTPATTPAAATGTVEGTPAVGTGVTPVTATEQDLPPATPPAPAQTTPALRATATTPRPATPPLGPLEVLAALDQEEEEEVLSGQRREILGPTHTAGTNSSSYSAPHHRAVFNFVICLFMIFRFPFNPLAFSEFWLSIIVE